MDLEFHWQNDKVMEFHATSKNDRGTPRLVELHETHLWNSVKLMEYQIEVEFHVRYRKK